MTYWNAEGGIRTRTPRGATPSRWCVCQFHHFGEEIRRLEARGYIISFPACSASLEREPERFAVVAAVPEAAEPAVAAAVVAVVDSVLRLRESPSFHPAE